MQTLTLGELTAQLDRSQPDVLAIRLSGRSASREAGKVLAPVFEQALGARAQGVRRVELHVERLDYFNSSTIAALVQFIRVAQQQGVGLTVFYDGKARWQTLSFDALRRALGPFQTDGAGTVQFTTAPE